MAIVRLFILLIGLVGSAANAAVFNTQCDNIYLLNNTERPMKVRGVYPDTDEKLKSFILQPGSGQQIVSLETIRSCSGNTNKVHCNVVWKQCHKQIHLLVEFIEKGRTAFSSLIHANDTVSFNPAPDGENVLVLINDVIQE